jgi:RHH-type proline utilization regulon transcriptional repressor/proline dehydrogenase/delta 1-pyrroline-5-carboxylate dehydrogenase
VAQAFLALAAGNAVALAQNQGAGSAGHVAEAFRQGGVPAALIAPVASFALSDFPALAIVAFDGPDVLAAPIRRELAARDGLRLRLTSFREGVEPFATERVVSIDTTASGGNASLLTLGDG